MTIHQNEIWIADLNPGIGAEPGKTRPVLVVQTDLLNQVPHPSTIICPISTNVAIESEVLRVHIKNGAAGVKQDCEILIDQLQTRMLNRIASCRARIVSCRARIISITCIKSFF